MFCTAVGTSDFNDWTLFNITKTVQTKSKSEKLIYERKNQIRRKVFVLREYIQKQGIAVHLKKHLAEETKKEAEGLSYLVRIKEDKRWGNSSYFLYLWIDGNKTLKTIDTYLRKIWLECCGHLSEFSLKYESEIPTKTKLRDVFNFNKKIQYIYDFGSSTDLELEKIEKYPFKAKKGIVLLSRNEPLSELCHECKNKTAISYCAVCDSIMKTSVFCKDCEKKHAKTCEDFEYSRYEIVNSPRMGICGYEGGIIDIERDKTIY